MINNNPGDLPGSSCTSLEKKHDVFISFRGEDTRYNFTSHLHNALTRNGINTYIDYNLVRGEEISKALTDAIDESKFCVVVFSKNYASSSWCLDELVHICECVKKKSLVVLPIFYHVDPSDVRRQKRSYADAFEKDINHFPKDKINKWKDALTTAANHAGWDASNSNNRPEAELVDATVNFIRGKLDKALSEKKDLVEMEEVILELNKLFSSVTKPQARGTMTVQLLVEPVVSISIDLLKKKIASDVVSFLRRKIVSDFDILDSLENTLHSLAEVLVDAENKQFKNPRVEKWLDNVEDVVEDAIILFEEIESDVMDLKKDMEYELDKSEVIKKFKSATQKRKAEMEKILNSLVKFGKQRDAFPLRGDVENIQSLIKPYSTTLSKFFGRDTEKEDLKRMLLSDDKVGSENICVIPIVGLGGIGKTTLAQAVYKDIQVKEHFEIKAWVCVSDEFEPSKVINKIRKVVAKNSCDTEDLSEWQEKIEENLDKKKYLIVLDDIWNDKYDFWETISAPFNVGAKGSKIIVTTRSKKVAKTVKTIEPLHLGVLEDEFCFELFLKIVSGNKEFTPTNSNLKRIGKELVKKCKGLPLAVKAVASLLLDTDVEKWQTIIKSDILDSDVGKERILPALRLSYHYLPSYLKRCFVYCSLFSKDFGFCKSDLISLWMADNLLEHSRGNKTMEEVGDEWFNALVSRSFFQLTDKDKFEDEFEDVYKMHDLMVDLAIFVSKEKFVYMKKDKMYDMRKIQHIAFADGINCRTSLSEAINVRTLMSYGSLDQDVLNDIMELRHLRFLLLHCWKLSELLASVGELRQLRHLELSSNSIKELPESLCLLYNLQTLNLRRCEHLFKLPENLYRLINLRHLYMSWCGFHTLPPLGQLPALLTLRIEGCNALKEVGALGQLPVLLTLRIEGCYALKKVGALGQLPALLTLRIERCDALKEVGALGQLPALLTLQIEECDALKKVGADFYGTSSSQSFPSLESLTFKDMRNWEEWSPPEASVKAFSKLTKLCLLSCPKFEGDLPRLLPSLRELDINHCKMLNSSLPEMPRVTKVQIKDCGLSTQFQYDSFSEWDMVNKNKLNPRSFDVEYSICSKWAPPANIPNIRNVEVLQLWGGRQEVQYISSSLDYFPGIKSVKVRRCGSVESFSLSNILKSLSTLYIERCLYFTLPSDTNFRDLLPSLQELTIIYCPELESFPGCGLPVSLQKLDIDSCDKLIASRKNWNLQSLPNLTFLRIAWYFGYAMESFLEQGSLPTSLTHLELVGILKLDTLDEKGFQELKCLKELRISYCPELQSLPVKGLQPSFEGLLPPSFETFVMRECPFLKEKYVWEKCSSSDESDSDDLSDVWEIRCIPRPQVPNSQHLSS